MSIHDVGRMLREIALAVGVFLVINTTAVASYYIPSESMVPNLLVGDHLIVSKFSYGFSRYSIVGGPNLFHGRIFEQPVRRGDIVVFKDPRDGDTNIIKRIIGLPGDVIETRDGILYINGTAIPRERIADFVYRDPAGVIEHVPQYRETLPGGRSYNIDKLPFRSSGDNAGPFVVPPEHYFAMGDNRENSLDSRWPVPVGGFGFVPAENIVGRAEAIVYSLNDQVAIGDPSTWFNLFRGARTLTKLR